MSEQSNRPRPHHSISGAPVDNQNSITAGPRRAVLRAYGCWKSWQLLMVSVSERIVHAEGSLARNFDDHERYHQVFKGWDIQRARKTGSHIYGFGAGERGAGIPERDVRGLVAQILY